jgi:pimeloyl-ACP methyl ester carboxylesterase
LPFDEYWYDSADGLRLFARIFPGPEAAAPVVLCLHGLTHNSRHFEDLARQLAPRYRVIVPDVRGRGLSARDPNSANYQIPVYLGDVLRALAGLGAARVTIIGTSMGGLMAMVLAQRAPQLVAGIVLNDVGAELERSGLERIRGYLGKAGPVADWAAAVAQLQLVYGPVWPGLDAARWQQLARASYRADVHGVLQPDFDPLVAEPLKDDGRAAPDLWPLWSAIARVPALVLRGASSDILSEATVARMRRAKPDLRAVTVANRGHPPLLDEPECRAAIGEFLATI